MRASLFVLACLLLALPVDAADKVAPGEEAIKTILTGVKEWGVAMEFTSENIPSDRAAKARFEFFRKGSLLKGRPTNVAAGYDVSST